MASLYHHTMTSSRVTKMMRPLWSGGYASVSISCRWFGTESVSSSSFLPAKKPSQQLPRTRDEPSIIVANSFDELALNTAITQSLNHLSISKPTYIQSGCIPRILKGDDLLIQAPRGSGKLVAALSSILHRLLFESTSINESSTSSSSSTSTSNRKKNHSLRVLILTPTVISAEEVQCTLLSLIPKDQSLNVAVWTPDEHIAEQKLKFKKKPPVIAIATPKRALQILAPELTKVRHTVLLQKDGAHLEDDSMELSMDELSARVHGIETIYYHQLDNIVRVTTHDLKKPEHFKHDKPSLILLRHLKSTNPDSQFISSGSHVNSSMRKLLHKHGVYNHRHIVLRDKVNQQIAQTDPRYHSSDEAK